MGEYDTIEASFRQSNISYEQLGNKPSKASKDNWMGEYETSIEKSFQQNNISYQQCIDMKQAFEVSSNW